MKIAEKNGRFRTCDDQNDVNDHKKTEKVIVLMSPKRNDWVIRKDKSISITRYCSKWRTVEWKYNRMEEFHPSKYPATVLCKVFVRELDEEFDSFEPDFQGPGV